MKKTLVNAGFRENRVSVVPPSFTGLRSIAKSFAEGRSTKMVLFVGRLSFEKGVPLLLQASKRISTSHQVVVAGDGGDRDRIEATAHQLGISERIQFAGWVEGDGLGALYAKASVVVMPSHSAETFGLVGLEAMVHSCPVVAFGVGGISDWLQDGVNGFLVKPWDVGVLALRIDTLLRDPELARQMGRRGRRIAETQFGPQLFLERALGAYQKAIDVFGGQ
jgi:glycosyltransferase involved in cell wall biosynthesis